MATREAFRAQAREMGVSDESLDLILTVVQPAYALKPGRSEEGAVGWLGGLPDLPTGMTWDGSGVFVASIDLAALPPHSLDTGLPADGRLLLFAEPFSELIDLDYGWPPAFPRALYVPPGTETTPWDPSSCTFERSDDEYLIERRPLHATAFWDLDINDESETLDSAVEEFRALAGPQVVPLVLDDPNYDVKLCGVAQAQQNTVEYEVLGRVGTRRGQAWEDDPDAGPSEDDPALIDWDELAAAWQPLAQANQSGITGVGDGAIYWVTPRVDLARARLDRTELIYQC
ncbi:DUF1963 domain-containing protein [Streptomyces sp. V2I9]|uniref:DUF1963 domain-containing protein n=1 Tax=unclassified Streptomyces TaxID=2593676 RepID=UPI00277F30B7|nr:DUF1963 domain-containing protein [Streptomyces sp. V2I9]MDQ0984277.1 hypothetical protein [Streptomyces sp. V2I9]